MPNQPQTTAAEAPTRSRFDILVCLIGAFAAEALLVAPWSISSQPAAALPRVLVVFITLLAIHFFALKALREYSPVRRDLLLMALVTIASLVMIKASTIVALSLSGYLREIGASTQPAAEVFYYAIPLASGAMLLQIVLGLHHGLVFAVNLAVLMAIYYPQQPIMAPYALTTVFVACLSIPRLRARSVFTRAGFNVAGIALPFALAASLMAPHSSSSEMLIRFLAAIIGGALCSFIAAGFLPVIEYLGGYITDLRLIEMATLDHPLLKDLSVTAPGTWNHCMIMGMMAESAADAVKANPVIARVGAYFHDIGKTRKPPYFIENQNGENRHDKLSPSMSALIVRSHVKDGIELAHKYHVPEVIVNMIPQHHGTARIEYFYNKARQEIEETGGNPDDVDESLYRYPGPKPQTREAGILMLADTIEAAARTVSDPNHDRIQGMVQKMINKVFSSGQLDECELTLRDLHLIARSFTRVLTGIYHQRIAYAEPAEKTGDKNQQKSSAKFETEANGHSKALESGDSTKKATQVPVSEQPEKSSTEDLKRLGLE